LTHHVLFSAIYYFYYGSLGLTALDIRLKAVEVAVQEQTETLLGIATVKKKGKYIEPPPQELVPIDDDHINDDETKGSIAQNNSTSSVGAAHTMNNGNAGVSDSTLKATDGKPWWQFW
jgi:hypothetical protein